MADSVTLLEFINMRVQCRWAHFEVAPQKSTQVGALFGAGEHLHAIASREHHSLIHARLLHQRTDGIRQLRLRNSKPLAHLQRRAVVVHADEVKVHGAINLCVWLKLLATQASTAAPKANVARYAARRPR